MLTRTRIAEQARLWIGTPYHNQAALMGVGCDCVGILQGIWLSLVGPLPAEVPPYSDQWHHHQKESLLLDMLINKFGFIDRGVDSNPPLGSVLCFGLKKMVAHHVGVVTGPGIFVHAIRTVQKVQEVELGAMWVSRLHRVLDFPGVIDE